jgi:hypothetical protein
LEKYKTYTIDELKLEDKDLQMNMTLGVVVSGSFLDLLRLMKNIKNVGGVRVIFQTISNEHLRVVKINQFEEFEEWKAKRV